MSNFPNQPVSPSVLLPVLTDAHCHLDHLSQPEEILKKAQSVGVKHFIVNGVWKSPGCFGKALDLATRHSCVSPTVAIHPHDCAHAPAEDWEEFARLANDPRVVAVGETGLDFHYHHSPASRQQEAFRWTIALAKRVKKPLVLHIRQAEREALNILKEENASQVGGQVHCFSGGPDGARQFLDLGFYLSFSGTITYKNSDQIREAACLTPRDRLLVETDSPYLAPQSHRGQRNEPAFLPETAQLLGKIRGEDWMNLAHQTTQNANCLFQCRVEV
jgi:TatD DNase family protein